MGDRHGAWKVLTVESGEDWGSTDTGRQQQGCLFSGLVCEHAGALFPVEAVPVPPERQVMATGGGGRALVLSNQLTPAIPTPLLLPHKSSAGPAAPRGELGEVWEGCLHPAAASP